MIRRYRSGRGAQMALCACVAAWAAAGATHAQLAVELSLDKKNYVAYEPMSSSAVPPDRAGCVSK
jgi:hypothetical protein